MPSASVRIEYDASLWPTEPKEFTDGVEEVFLQASDDDEEDSMPLGQLLLQPQCHEDGEWSLEAQRKLQEYATSEHATRDPDGNIVDLSISDPEVGE